MRRLALLLLLTCSSGLVIAEAVSVAPLRIELGSERNASLTVRNGDAPRTYQARAVQWRQSAGVDSYQPTQEVLVVPATFRLAPGASQVVRVALNRERDTAEHAYRIFIDEVVEAGRVVREGTVTTALSLGIPAFVAPAGGRPVTGMLEIGAQRTPDGIRIDAKNTGVANLKVQGISVKSGTASIAEVAAADYVLSQGTRSWQLPLFNAPPEGALAVTVTTDRGTFSTAAR
jgi:fimbrial chaperone protein